jgi:hypothetical protein
MFCRERCRRVLCGVISSLTKELTTHGLERVFADKNQHKPPPERSHSKRVSFFIIVSRRSHDSSGLTKFIISNEPRPRRHETFWRRVPVSLLRRRLQIRHHQGKLQPYCTHSPCNTSPRYRYWGPSSAAQAFALGVPQQLPPAASWTCWTQRWISCALFRPRQLGLTRLHRRLSWLQRRRQQLYCLRLSSS